MTSDIVVHIAHKLATVKNVSVNVSDTSPRTSSTMENEDANVAENRNATNAGTLSEASRQSTFRRNCFCFSFVTSFVTSFFTSSSKERERERKRWRHHERVLYINDFVVERERERERKRWRHHERVLYINDFYSIKERERKRRETKERERRRRRRKQKKKL